MIKQLNIRRVDDGAETVMAVAPQGMTVTRLSYQRPDWAHPLELLEQTDAADLSSNLASRGAAQIVPGGRVGPNQSGYFTFGAKDYIVQPTRHGPVRHREFEIARNSPPHILHGSAIINIPPAMKEGRQVFRWKYRIETTLELMPGGMEWRVEIASLADYPQPIGWGLHPYFPVDRSRSARVELPGTRLLVLHEDDDEPTPTGGHSDVRGTELDFSSGRDVGPNDQFDHIWYADGNPKAAVTQTTRVEMHSGHTEELEVQRSVNFPDDPDLQPIEFWQLYTPERDAVAIEPLAGPGWALSMPDAFEMTVLEPEARLHYALQLSMEIMP